MKTAEFFSWKQNCTISNRFDFIVIWPILLTQEIKQKLHLSCKIANCILSLVFSCAFTFFTLEWYEQVEHSLSSSKVWKFIFTQCQRKNTIIIVILLRLWNVLMISLWWNLAVIFLDLYEGTSSQTTKLEPVTALSQGTKLELAVHSFFTQWLN